MKINTIKDKFHKFYMVGLYIILALPLLIFPPYFAPVDWGKTIVFRSILAILLFFFCWQTLYKKSGSSLHSIKKNKIVWILALFSALILLATLFSQDINFSLWGSPYRAEGAVDFFFYIIFGVLSFLIIKPSDWNKILNFSIFIGILVCLIAVIQFYGLFNHIFISSMGRSPSTMGNPIMLGVYLLLLFFITLASAIKEKITAKKIAYLSILLLFFLTILITGSRAAYLGIIFGGIYFFLFYPVKSLPLQSFSIEKTEQPSQKINTPKNLLLKIYGWILSRKIALIKILFATLLILGVLLVFYINSQKTFPQFLEKNKVFQMVQNRLSFSLVLTDSRFSAWQVALKAIGEKPILGWGPENLSIGFDKYYNPSLPYLSKGWGGWWDRAHNILLDTATTLGIPALIIYLTLFVILFWYLHKTKIYQRKSVIISENPQLMAHGIQATLIAYIVANLFSFDGFSTYLLFYLIIGYSLFLTTQDNTQNGTQTNIEQKKVWWKSAFVFTSFIILIIFLWQYNLVPLQINAQINKSDSLADSKKCDQSLVIAEKNIKEKHSFLDAYAVIHYVEAIQSCAAINPNKNLEYAQKGIEAMEDAVKIRPLYSRFWMFLGSFTTVKASLEQNPEIKKNLIAEANDYFLEALKLAPNHQEIITEQAKADMVAGNFTAMKQKSEKCIALDSSLGDCYWIKALSEIYLKDFEAAKKDIKTANDKLLTATSISSLQQIANAYASVKNYEELAIVYRQLVQLRPDEPQYHASLAFACAKLGLYKEARQNALIFLQLMPEAKDEVNDFLKALPY